MSMRHYITILEQADAIKKKIKRSYKEEFKSDYDEACQMWNLAFVELLRAGYPFISIVDADAVRINIDEVNYEIRRSFLYQWLGREEASSILENDKFINPCDYTSLDDEDKITKLHKQINEQVNNDAAKEVEEKAKKEKEEQELLLAEEKTKKGKNKAKNIAVQNEIAVSSKNEIEDVWVDNGIAKKVNTVDFAFIGLEHGVGTTHTAIMFAQLLATSKNRRVIYYEANDSQHMKDMARWTTGEKLTEKFTLKGVDFVYGIDYDTFLKKYHYKYDFAVIDFGLYKENEDISDFIRIKNKFVIASGIDWRLPTLKNFYNSFKYDKLHDIKYLIPYMTKDSLDYIKEIIVDNDVATLPFNMNPFEPNKDVLQTFYDALGIKVFETTPSNALPKKNQKRFLLTSKK